MLKHHSIILFFFVFLGFFPTYFFGDSIQMGQTVLFLIFPVIISIILIFTLIDKKNDKIIFPFISKCLLFCAIIFFTLTLSKISFIDLRLIINHSRYFSYFLIFTAVYNIIYYSSFSFLMFDKVLMKFGLLLSFFVIIQIIFPSSYFVLLETHKPAIDFLGFRIGGSLEWSYIFAFITFPIIIIGFHKIMRKNTHYLSMVSIVLFSMYLLTQSKVAYIVIVLFSLYYLIYSICTYKNNKRLYTFVLICLFLISFVLYRYWDMFSHVIGFIDKIDSGEIDASTQTRVEQIKTMLFYWKNNIWFGYPKLYIIIENSYAHYLYNYGIVGSVLYMLLFYIIAYSAYVKHKCFTKDRDEEKIAISLSMFVFSSSVFIYALGSSPTDANKSSYLFFLIIGIYFGMCDRDKNKNGKNI